MRRISWRATASAALASLTALTLLGAATGCASSGALGGVAAAPTAPTAAPASTTRSTTTTTTAATTATTLPPTTMLPPTTLPPTTATAATTTLAPTTLPPTTITPVTTAANPASLPQPIAAPSDTNGTEARIELGAIEIPRLGLTRAMFEGIRLPTLDNGPGHWPGTAMPGQLGNVVVAGHRVSNNEDFRHIDQLESGDEVVFTTSAGRFVYLVETTEIVGPEALWIVDQTPEHRATLFACHPPGSVAERIVVHLRLAA